MPIKNVQDAIEVHEHIEWVFDADRPDERAQAIRRLFVDVLDFADQRGQVALASTPAGVKLPQFAERIAVLDGVHVCYIALDTSETDRVRKQEAVAAARQLANELGDDLLLVFINPSGSQLHLIHPLFETAQPTLRRMVVEKGLPRRTAIQQIANIYSNYGDSGSIRAALKSAFDVGPVTKHFFAEYKRVFEAAEKLISGFNVKSDDDDEASLETEARTTFAQTLFNRLMFVHFVSRKGWLRFDGDNDYLKALWNSYQARSDESNFYKDRLRPLFFCGLNNESLTDVNRTDGYMNSVYGDVKFLNGGLFDPNDLDRREDIEVPDPALEPLLREEAGLFHAFNFTVMESTPLDTEVAVDPEMLGKVFEELINERNSTGAYYTPRPVVTFMCREALKGYLVRRCDSLSSSGIEVFIDDRDTCGISLDAAPSISRALDDISIVDPACGSGAYLVGMLQELVELHTVLFDVGIDPLSIYNLKLRIIERNLYGADIDDFAVNIAMLRLWLSLAIDFDGDDPESLPNLDFKILTGDSLLGPVPSRNQTADMFHHAVIKSGLRELKAEYLRATDGSKKRRLREKIKDVRVRLEDSIGDISAYEHCIDWRVDFAEAVRERVGFDIVLANPPYGISTHGDRADAISQRDSYANFMMLASEIAPHGSMAYITPTSWETGERYETFRRVLFEHLRLETLVNLPYDIFETPYVDTAVTVGRFDNDRPSAFRLATLEKRSELDLTKLSHELEYVDWNCVSEDRTFRVPLLAWASPLFRRLSEQATPLDELIKSKRGIEAYQFDISQDRVDESLPYFDGQVQRYEVIPPTMRKFVSVNERTAEFHTGPRILTRRIVSRSNRLMSAVATGDFVVKKDLYSLKCDSLGPDQLPILLAILNSSLLSFLYLSRSAAATKDDFRQVSLSGLRELPIMLPESDAQKSELVELALRRSRIVRDTGRVDAMIDDMVYRSYGVSDIERERIESWLNRRG